MTGWFSDVDKFVDDPLTFLQEKGTYINNKVERLYLGSMTYLITDPSEIEYVQKKSVGIMSEGSTYYKLKRRKITFPMGKSNYSSSRMGDISYSQQFETAVQKYLPEIMAIIREEIFKLAGRPEFNANKVMSRMALKIMATLMFGHRVMRPEEETAFLKAINLVEKKTVFPMHRVFPAIGDEMSKVAHQQTARDIVSSVLEDVVKRSPNVSMLSSDRIKGNMTDEQYNTILGLILTGYYSIGSAASWMLYFTAIMNGLQDDLANEAENVTDSVGDIQYHCLETAKHSSTLVHEVLRLYPLTWWSARSLKETIVLGRHIIEPGALMVVSPWQLGRDLKFWQKPEYFRLDRNYKKPAFCPFGAGPKADQAATVVMKILQVIAMSFASSFRLRYQSHFPAPPPRPVEALLAPEISMCM